MLNLKFCIPGALAFFLAFSACSSPVSSVEVKATPTLYASLGQYTYQVSSYLNPSKIESFASNPTGLSVYNYVPTTPTPYTGPQEYMLHYPLLSVPLNFGTNLSNLNLSSMVNTNIPAQSFTIPSVNQTVNAPATLDVNAVLLNAVNTGLTSTPVSIGETGLPSPPLATVSVSLSIPSFSSVTVATGSMNLTFGAVSSPTSGFTLTVTKVEMDTTSGTTITSSNTSVNLITGGIASLPFSSGTNLPSSFTLKLTVSTSGGTTGQLDSFTLQAALSSDFTISAATGVNFSTSVAVPATSIPLTTASNFVSATVGASSGGSLVITTGSLPSVWTGFTQSTAITVAQTGGLNLNQTGNGTITIDLSNQTISANTISVNGSTTMTATNATITGLSGPITLSNQAVIDVTSFASVTVKPGSSFQPTTTINYNLLTSLSTQQQQMWKWVNYIDFTSVGFNLSFGNTLPAGNDMSMTVQSNAFGISQTQALPSNQTTPASFVSGTTAAPYKYSPSQNYGAGAYVIDLTVTLAPKAWNAATGELTLYNIVPGSTLNFSANLTPVATWSDANLSPQTGGYSGTFPASGSYDLSSLATYLGSNFTFPTTPAYIYLSGLTQATGITAYLQAQYTNAGVLTKTDLLGSSASPATINMLTSIPTFPADGSPLPSIPSYSFEIPDLSFPLNAKPKDLVLNYSLNMSSVNVTYAEATGTANQTLEADLLIPLPLTFNIPATGATLNFNSPAGTDFFGRTASNSTNINNLLSSLTSMTLTLTVDNTTGLTGTALFTDGSGFSKSLTLLTGPNTINLSLTATDAQHIVSTIPFVPSLQVTLNPSGAPETVSIPANGITASASVTAVSNVDQTYSF